MRTLLVEDNDDLAEAIVERLAREGHAVDHERDGVEGDALLSHHEAFDLVILDVNLPGCSGFEILRRMRARGDDTPVLVLTARSEIEDRVAGLDDGADDFMVKPFDFRELVARCRMLARRRSGAGSNLFAVGGLRFDRAARMATLDGRPLDLRAREVQLLEVVIDNLGRLMTKEDLADRLYTFAEAPSLNAIEQQIARLRAKIEGSPLRIKTVRGLGYLGFVDDDAG